MTHPDPTSPEALSGHQEGHTGRYVTGLYRAVVLDTNDPDQRARVKVRVFQLHGEPQEVPDVDCPWAEPCFPPLGTQDADEGATVLPGWVTIPPVGTTLWVGFENGYIENPVYLGQWYGQVGGVELPTEADDTNVDGSSVLPGRRVFKTAAGHVIVIDDNEDTKGIRVSTAGGKKINLDDKNDKIEIEDQSGVVIEIDAAAGTVIVKHTSEVEVEAPSIKLGAAASDALMRDVIIPKLDGHSHPILSGSSAGETSTMALSGSNPTTLVGDETTKVTGE